MFTSLLLLLLFFHSTIIIFFFRCLCILFLIVQLQYVCIMYLGWLQKRESHHHLKRFVCIHTNSDDFQNRFVRILHLLLLFFLKEKGKEIVCWRWCRQWYFFFVALYSSLYRFVVFAYFVIVTSCELSILYAIFAKKTNTIIMSKRQCELMCAIAMHNTVPLINVDAAIIRVIYHQFTISNLQEFFRYCCCCIHLRSLFSVFVIAFLHSFLFHIIIKFIDVAHCGCIHWLQIVYISLTWLIFLPPFSFFSWFIVIYLQI